MNAARYVPVARRGDEWSRLDRHPGSTWRAMPNLDQARQAVAKVAGLPGTLPMGVVDAETGQLVWTADNTAPAPPPEQLNLI